MFKTRLQFSKKDALRFIGHLDFLRVFGQTLRRSGLPVAYSQGFNPHILLSFALPLPLGMASQCDYADLTFAQAISLDDAKLAIQKNAPKGLEILNIWEAQGRNTAAITAAADYTLTGEVKVDLLSANEYIIPKKTKSGTKPTDIRPDIFNITTQDNQITMRLAAGSGRFLNPLIVAKLITGREVSTSDITRAELYEQLGEAFLPLGRG